MRRDAALGDRAVGAGVGDGEQEGALQRLGDGLEHAGFGAHRRAGAGGEALRLEHRLGVGLGAARVRAGHAGEQPVAQRRERGHVGRGALALGAADRHLERGELVVADALEAGEARVAQLPAAPAVLVGADLHAGEGVLERAGHALRGAVVGAELLGDLGERDPLVPGRRHLGEAHQVPGLGKRHRATLRTSGGEAPCGAIGRSRETTKNRVHYRAFRDDAHPVYDVVTSTVELTPSPEARCIMTGFVTDASQIRKPRATRPAGGRSGQGWGRRGESGEMQRNECGVLLSASDLMRFAGCAHATTLDLAWMMGRGAAPGEDSEDAQLLQRHGDAHEARHLARLEGRGPERRRDRPGGRVAGAGRRRRPARRWSGAPRWCSRGRSPAAPGAAGATSSSGSSGRRRSAPGPTRSPTPS